MTNSERSEVTNSERSEVTRKVVIRGDFMCYFDISWSFPGDFNFGWSEGGHLGNFWKIEIWRSKKWSKNKFFGKSIRK